LAQSAQFQNGRSPIPFSWQCFEDKVIEVECDLLFWASRAPQVSYFELFQFDRGTKRLIPFTIASLEDFHSNRIMRSRSFPAGMIFVYQQSSETDVQLTEHLESLLPRGAVGHFPD
jgi:hypothetical protein